MFGLSDKNKCHAHSDNLSNSCTIQDHTNQIEFLNKLKALFFDIHNSTIHDWRLFTPEAIKFFEFFREHAPFTPEERAEHLTKTPLEKEKLTKQERKQKRHWLRWKK